MTMDLDITAYDSLGKMCLKFLINKSFKFFKILLCHFTSCLLSMGERVVLPSCRAAAAHLLLCKAGAQILKNKYETLTECR
jgi:hypothetical protein